MVDQYAPISHLRPTAAPILIITGDRELEPYGRYGENAYFWRMMQLSGHPAVYLKELQACDHGGMAEPASLLTLRFLRGQFP